MSLNWENLVSQGRAKALGVAWQPEELDALLALRDARSLTMLEAADQVRNGITTPEDYDKAHKVGFVPTKLTDALDSALSGLKDHGPAALKKAKPKTK